MRMVSKKSITKVQNATFHGSLAFILQLASCCGLTPLLFHRAANGQWRARKSTGLYCYGIMYLIIIVTARGIAISLFIYQYSLCGGPLSIVRIIELTLVSSCLLVVGVTASSRADSMFILADILKQINRNIQPTSNDFAKADLTALKVGMLTLFLSAAVIIFDFVVQILANETIGITVLNWISFTFTSLSIMIKEMTFIFMIKLVVIRAEALILKLQNLKTKQDNYSSTFVIKELVLASHAQEQLRTAARLINSMFDAPLLIIIVLAILQITVALANLLTYSNVAEDFQVLGFCISILWSMKQIWWLLQLLETCHQISMKDALITSCQLDLLHSLSERGMHGVSWSDGIELEQLWRWQQIALSSPLAMTARGVSKLNRRFLGTISGAITTYIVIVMQF